MSTYIYPKSHVNKTPNITMSCGMIYDIIFKVEIKVNTYEVTKLHTQEHNLANLVITY